MALYRSRERETDWADHFVRVSAPQAIVGYVETCHARLRPRQIVLVVSALIRARSGECAIGVEPVEFGKAVIAVRKMDPQTPVEWQQVVDACQGLLALDSARQYGLVTGGPVIDVDRCWELLARGRAKGFVPGHSFSSRRRSDDCRAG